MRRARHSACSFLRFLPKPTENGWFAPASHVRTTTQSVSLHERRRGQHISSQGPHGVCDGWYFVAQHAKVASSCTRILTRRIPLNLFHTTVDSLAHAASETLLYPIRQSSQHANLAQAAWQDYLATAAAHDLSNNRIGNGRRLKNGRSSPLELLLHRFYQRCADPIRVDGRSEHVWAVVVVLKLLVERYRGSACRKQEMR